MAATTIVHTAHLDAATRAAAEALLREAFLEFDDEDWDHALGGMHALVHDGGELVAHGSVVQRRFLHAGRTWRTGYVEAVGVAAGVRRGGHGTAVMRGLEAVIRGAYELGALSATADGRPLYRSLGWQLWQGPVSALTPTGTVRTPDEDGAVFVLPVTARLDLTGELTCDWRDGPLW
ncbi:GNAT family N-acetyltransferase [Modestobacter altitudinis]|uniref:GNAT family N-acetyltransferase n=1 Tax=Modestobacter altitudinis TaxID=2213158 RepID=UPI00110CF1DE|nr:GNAT family N-acetyltransferase [Modestobacter altitudinis]